ncbi:hypothetical protein RTM1035_06438 [Roseovarius sp. TM1035]|uniref:hypothetical protein n=1 Tax=Roseovarius sp. TM1035 TaxID=391613 RepID=UPI00015566A1|nr:hypothetical protein [Roseovarius sp. TM1035]EDM30841.1 hypothetical protein RTM1035_06438 [Roseovarius sp. TM1035]
MNTRAENLKAEIKQVQSILDGIPEENVIDRYSIKQRLDDLNENLSLLSDSRSDAERLALTFRGDPVIGSRAISADFAGKAAATFHDAFSAILAGINSRLRYSGPIPDKAQFPLMITGTALGSFGFEMEVPEHAPNLFDEPIGSSDAITIFKQLLRVSATGSDDDISDIVEEIHPRAVRKVADFLSVLSKQNAWCGLEFRNDFFRYGDLEELRLSESRLRKENIDERIETYSGEFQGFLPVGRNFEFKVLDDGFVLKGRLSEDIEDTSVLNREWLHKPVTVKFSVVQVGQGRPRFTLASLNDIT